MTADRSGLVRFGGFELDPGTGELWRDGEPVDLPPQPSRVLALLARRPGRIVTREEIQDEVWGDTVVEFDQAINNAVRQVRDALGDDASDPRFIETVPRRGYRFIAPIETVRIDAGDRTAPDAEPAEGQDGRPTGEGVKGSGMSGRTSSGGARAPASRPRFGAGAAFALGVAVTLAVAAAVWFGFGRGAMERGTVVAVVPARATTAGSPAEAVADTLTPMLAEALSALAEEGLTVIPWSWDMSLDPETGEAVRDGEVVDVDVLAETVVYQEADGFEVSVTLTRLPGGIQIWHRRVEGLEGGPAEVAARIVAEVVDAVRERILSGS